MCTRILQSVPAIAIYERPEDAMDGVADMIATSDQIPAIMQDTDASGLAITRKQNYLDQEFSNIRKGVSDAQIRDNVEFTAEVSEEDFKKMELLRWLQKQKDFATTLGYYNELARKFLFEEKPKAAIHLLEQLLV